METKPNKSDQQQDSKAQLAVQHMYVKSSAFDVLTKPQLLKDLKSWKPKANFEIKIQNEKIDDDLYEATLDLKITTTQDEKELYTVNVTQAGIFLLKEFNEEQMKQLLNSYCPSLLFPYARQMIDNLVVGGGFPAMQLAPMNFDAIYAQRLAKEKEQQKVN